MAKHEFGLMETAPVRGVRYDSYEPDQYHCIAAEDEALERYQWDFRDLDCFAHTLDCPAEGLAWCGITLIPPHTAREMAWMIRFDPSLAALISLCDRAAAENKYIIHFGL